MKAFLDRYALALSMLIGVVGYPVFRHLTPLLPSMIFLMLFFTFSKVDPLQLRVVRWHVIVLLAQLVLAIGTYYLLAHWLGNGSVAQGLMCCFIMPTATAGPIIAAKLGGNIQSLTAFTLLSNIATAIIVPAFFPIVNVEAHMSFWWASLMIMRRVSPLLLGPFFAAWLMRVLVFKKHPMPQSISGMPFYLWAGTLVILLADITYSMLHATYTGGTIVALFGGALVSCLMQFAIGKWVGGNTDSITVGQAFGQKNTTLGVWMAQTFLCPLAALAPAAYIIWQNLFNSLQLIYYKRR